MATAKVTYSLKDNENEKLKALVLKIRESLVTLIGTTDINTISIAADNKVSCQTSAQAFALVRGETNEQELQFQEPAPIDRESIQEATFELAAGEKQSDYNDNKFYELFSEVQRVFDRAIETPDFNDPISGRNAGDVLRFVEEHYELEQTFEDATSEDVYEIGKKMRLRLESAIGSPVVG